MKKSERFLALLLSTMILFSGSMITFAAGETSAVNVSVKGIEDEKSLICTNEEENHDHGEVCYKSLLSVKAYQIITYDERGFYKEVLDDTISKGDVLTTVDGKEIQELIPDAENIQTLFRTSLNQFSDVHICDFEKNEDGSYTPAGDVILSPGTWMVTVSGSDKYIYNPAIVSVNITPDGIVYGTLNLETDSWAQPGETPLYLKRDEPQITKTAESAATVDGRTDPVVTGTQFGDILKFKIEADIPGYMKNKLNIEYSIEDILTGLTLVKNEQYQPSATIAGATPEDIKAADTAVKDAVSHGAAGFIMDSLSSEFLVRNANKKITIVYFAKVTSTELVNVDQLNNTAKLSYSTNDTDRVRTKEDETKHYTFGFDTSVIGTIGTGTQDKTGEFIKINDKGSVKYSETNAGEIVKTNELVEYLNDAEFQLHIGSAQGKLFKDKQNKEIFRTDGSGRLQIVGLDDDTDYFLVETKAPTGYSIRTDPIRIRITADYDENDDLKGYSVAIGEKENEQVTHYSYYVVNGKTDVVNTGDTASNPYGFKNTKLTELPSTGGVGTTIFTFGGCMAMVTAAGLYFANCKKNKK